MRLAIVLILATSLAACTLPTGEEKSGETTQALTHHSIAMYPSPLPQTGAVNLGHSDWTEGPGWTERSCGPSGCSDGASYQGTALRNFSTQDFVWMPTSNGFGSGFAAFKFPPLVVGNNTCGYTNPRNIDVVYNYELITGNSIAYLAAITDSIGHGAAVVNAAFWPLAANFAGWVAYDPLQNPQSNAPWTMADLGCGNVTAGYYGLDEAGSNAGMSWTGFYLQVSFDADN